ncbi:hypothetical protein [Metabacillus malikii]|uniref:Uncharacterized protein n=1 Tax=Metabacillus malikii TaxID=1504265 RepID=A0ABT9ZIB9_9BACI|nr:hypothetical protein [Metabacillus malikii]MDQ0232030.1 hypothetical protein [Metabacillus malikii]
MKKYIVFLASFMLLYVAYQYISGFILTLMYTPDFSAFNMDEIENLTQEVTFGQQFPFSSDLIPFIICGSLAFILSEKLWLGKNEKFPI